MPIRHKIFIFFILLLSLIIRSYQLDTIPSLNPDEAALGYNAYSLILTGRDEHGISWPLHFKSFGDYKPGGYVYLALPFVKILGLNTLSVRLPNLILSVLSIYIFYRLLLLVTPDYLLANLSAMVLTLNPWHIHFSRGAWESSASIFFILLSLYLFYSYISKSRSIYLYLFPIPACISLYIYHSARLIVPLLFIILFILNFKKLTLSVPSLFKTFIIGLIFLIPVVYSFLTSGGLSRFGGVGLTADHGPISRAEELLNQHGDTYLINRITHNKRILYLIAFFDNYFSHFNFDFLFLNGDQVPRSRSPDIGQFYFFEVILLTIGIASVAKRKLLLRQILLCLLIVSPLAAALTFQTPSALRSLLLCYPLSLLIALGLVAIIHYRRLFIIPIFVIYLYSFAYLSDAYYTHSPRRYPFAWNYGFREVVEYLEEYKSNYQHIYFTNTYDQPYILYLFFSMYPPSLLQTQINLTTADQYGFSTVKYIDNITFDKIDWDKIPQNSLIVGADEAIPSSPQKIFYFLNGQPGFKIYTK